MSPVKAGCLLLVCVPSLSRLCICSIPSDQPCWSLISWLLSGARDWREWQVACEAFRTEPPPEFEDAAESALALFTAGETLLMHMNSVVTAGALDLCSRAEAGPEEAQVC